jgi:Mrp family chromosome partitioning ATPase
MKTTKKIVFYSYKGGTGRTLLLANTAKFLSLIGKKVFLIDLDLEAPGLIRKFGKTAEVGFVDFIDEAISGKLSKMKIKDFVTRIYDNNSEINILAAGDAFSKEYKVKLARINWHSLFYKKPTLFNKPLGDIIFETLFNKINEEFPEIDYVLIDSRTGITDIGGVLLNDFSDEIVCLMLNNEENFDGISKVLSMAYRRNKPCYPIASKIPFNLSNANEESVINGIKSKILKRINDENYTFPYLNILHSDVGIEFYEQIKYAEHKVLKHSILLQDYLVLFDNIFKEDIKSAIDNRYKKYLDFVINNKDTIGISSNKSNRPYDFKENDSERIKHIIDEGFKLQVVESRYFDGKYVKEFTNKIIARLESVDHFDMRRNVLIRNINWNLIGFQFSEGAIDFFGDLYFLTETRNNLVDILQLGYLETFVALVPQNIHVEPNHEQGNEIKYLFDFFRNFSQKSEYKYIVMGDQAAASECYRLFSKIKLLDNTTLYDNVYSEKDEFDIASRLKNSQEKNIAILDHVTSRVVMENNNDIAKEYKELHFHFQNKIPVGYLYKKNCPNIRYEINKAIYEVLKHTDSEFNWELLSAELKTNYHIVPFEWDDLKANIIWDLKLHEALNFNNLTISENENSSKQNEQKK